jgi:putative ABC transport system ATP-binding protein
MDALVVDKVRKTFEAENAPVRALRGANLVVPSGDFVALMGPSGCGKSTLLNLVAGLDVADEGTITVAGEQVTGRSEDELSLLRRKHIGIVFQFFNLLEGMTVLENVALPAVIANDSLLPAPWPTSPRSFWPTNRREPWTPKVARRSLSS